MVEQSWWLGRTLQLASDIGTLPVRPMAPLTQRQPTSFIHLLTH